MKRNDVLIAIVIFILFLLGMAFLPYIPLLILRIKLDDLSQNVKILYNFFCDLVFMIIIFISFKNDMIKDFKNYISDFLKNFEISFKYYFIGLIIMMVSNLIIGLVFKNANANNEETIRNLINLYPLYMLFSVSIYAPIVEETIFRKCIRNIFRWEKGNKLAKYLFIITSGLIFSSLHVLGMTNSIFDYLYIIPYLALGISFAALYYKTDNIFCSIVMHSLHNSAAIILYLILGIV